MLIDITLVIAWAILQIPLGFWLFKAKPSKQIVEKYPKLVVFQSSVPFMKNWRNKIQSADLKIFEEYRKRVLIQYYLCFTLPILLFFLYLYIKYVYFDPWPIELKPF